MFVMVVWVWLHVKSCSPIHQMRYFCSDAQGVEATTVPTHCFRREIIFGDFINLESCWIESLVVFSFSKPS